MRQTPDTHSILWQIISLRSTGLFWSEEKYFLRSLHTNASMWHRNVCAEKCNNLESKSKQRGMSYAGGLNFQFTRVKRAQRSPWDSSEKQAAVSVLQNAWSRGRVACVKLLSIAGISAGWWRFSQNARGVKRQKAEICRKPIQRHPRRRLNWLACCGQERAGPDFFSVLPCTLYIYSSAIAITDRQYFIESRGISNNERRPWRARKYIKVYGAN